MWPLSVLSARAVAIALFVVLLVGGLAGGIRLLPWVFAPEVPALLAVPFGKLLLGQALDAAVAVGLPVGLAVAASRFVERGEARALHALGVSPLRLLWPVLLLVVMVAGLHTACSVMLRSPAPGHFMGDLLAQGRAACAAAGALRRVEVPLAGVTWLCFDAGPRLVGRVPGVGAEVWFSAASVRPSGDLRQIELSELQLGARLGTHRVSLRSGGARLFGLPAWGSRSGPSEGPWRSVRLGLAAGALSVVVASATLARPRAAPLRAAAAAAAGATVLLVLLRRLEPHFAAVPAAVLASVLAFALAFASRTARESPEVARPTGR